MKEELVDREAVTDKKKKLLSVFGVLLSVLLLILLVYYVNCVQPVQQFETYYKECHYTDAYNLYNESLTRIQSNARKAELMVQEHTDLLWTQYKDASIGRQALEDAIASAKQYEALADYIQRLTSNADILFASREQYDNGVSLLEKGEWLEAMNSFNLVSKDDLLYKDSQALILTAQEGYCKQIMEEADLLAADKKYEEAITLVDQVLKEYPSHEELASHKEVLYKAFKEYQKETGLVEVQEYLEEGNLEEALAILVELQDYFPDDEGISSAFEEYEALYSQEIITQAQPLYDEAQYEEALEILAPAYKLLPKNDAIADLYDMTAGHLPAWLCNFAYEDVSLRGTRKVEKKTTDVHGNSYEHAIVYTEPSALSMQTMAYTEGKETYSLHGAYTRLIGTLAVKEGSRGIRNNQTGTFRVYNGDEVLLEIDGISEESKAVPFSVDITGTELLSFTFESGIGLKYILGDICVYKTYPDDVNNN